MLKSPLRGSGKRKSAFTQWVPKNKTQNDRGVAKRILPGYITPTKPVAKDKDYITYQFIGVPASKYLNENMYPFFRNIPTRRVKNFKAFKVSEYTMNNDQLRRLFDLWPGRMDRILIESKEQIQALADGLKEWYESQTLEMLLLEKLRREEEFAKSMTAARSARPKAVAVTNIVAVTRRIENSAKKYTLNSFHCAGLCIPDAQTAMYFLSIGKYPHTIDTVKAKLKLSEKELAHVWGIYRIETFKELALSQRLNGIVYSSSRQNKLIKRLIYERDMRPKQSGVFERCRALTPMETYVYWKYVTSEHTQFTYGECDLSVENFSRAEADVLIDGLKRIPKAARRKTRRKVTAQSNCAK